MVKRRSANQGKVVAKHRTSLEKPSDGTEKIRMAWRWKRKVRKSMATEKKRSELRSNGKTVQAADTSTKATIRKRVETKGQDPERQRRRVLSLKRNGIVPIWKRAQQECQVMEYQRLDWIRFSSAWSRNGKNRIAKQWNCLSRPWKINVQTGIAYLSHGEEQPVLELTGQGKDPGDFPGAFFASISPRF